jgi:CubicO group peptidase (beta-lactamase class C family)
MVFLFVSILALIAVDQDQTQPTSIEISEPSEVKLIPEDVSCEDGKYLMVGPSDKAECVEGVKISEFELKGWDLILNLDCDTVDNSNWGLPPNKFCGFNNFEKVVRFTQIVDRGDGPVNEFGSNPKDLSHLTVQWGDNESSFDEFLEYGHVDAFLVLQGNDIVFEKYVRMDKNDRHPIQSVSKTSVPALIHEYFENGMLDPNKKVSEYIPEMGSGYADATVQALLDMDVTNSYSEDYFDPNAGVWESEIALGWKPDPENKYPSLKKWIAQTITSDDVTGTGDMQYKSMNTEVAGWLIEEVSGEDFGELFEEKIYQHIGAEQDAVFTTDSEGFASPGGGLIMTLQDLGRYGQLWANDGVSFDGTQVIPKDWIEAHRTDSKGTKYPYFPGYRYHDQLWSNGNVLGHQGWGGQNLFVDPQTKVVVVIFSSHADASGVHPYGPVAFHDLSEKISEYLSQ